MYIAAGMQKIQVLLFRDFLEFFSPKIFDLWLVETADVEPVDSTILRSHHSFSLCFGFCFSSWPQIAYWNITACLGGRQFTSLANDGCKWGLSWVTALCVGNVESNPLQMKQLVAGLGELTSDCGASFQVCCHEVKGSPMPSLHNSLKYGYCSTDAAEKWHIPGLNCARNCSYLMSYEFSGLIPTADVSSLVYLTPDSNYISVPSSIEGDLKS